VCEGNVGGSNPSHTHYHMN